MSTASFKIHISLYQVNNLRILKEVWNIYAFKGFKCRKEEKICTVQHLKDKAIIVPHIFIYMNIT